MPVQELRDLQVYYELPAAGHAVMNDQPELFRIAALDFLQRVESL